MAKKLVAILAVLLVAAVSRAGDSKMPDKYAPTTFATAPAAPAPAACPASCDSCGHCRSCWGKCKDWICFVPLRTCPCECKHCSSCYAPLYVYFLKPCVEGPNRWHYDNHCNACFHDSRTNCDGGCGTGHRWWGWNVGCATCGSGK